MPTSATMRWPNGSSTASATIGGSSRTANQKAPSARMSGAPAQRLAKQAPRPHRQDHQHADIESSRCPGIAEASRYEGLESANTQRRQKRAGHAAPAAQRHRDISLQHVTGALGRRDQELMPQQQAGDARQRAGVRQREDDIAA